MGELELGDARRTRRLIRLVEDLSAQPLGSLPVASGGWAETTAAYRRLDNPALEWRELLEVHTPRTRERMSGQPVVLCMQDRTAVDVSTQPGIAGLGRLSYEAQHGRQLHPTRVVTPQGAALGVVDAWMWARAPTGKATVKESMRWLQGYGIIAALAEVTPGTQVVQLADREGDIRALMDDATRRGTPADWLIRARHERKTASGDKLWAGLGASEPRGAIAVTLPTAPGRPSRRVQQTLYLQRVTLPARKGAPPVSVTALRAREEHPPAGEKAIEWRLRTNRSAATLEDAVELREWDRCRWLVEIVFSLLNSGCRVEALPLATLERLERALVIDRMSAWRLLQLVTWGRDSPD